MQFTGRRKPILISGAGKVVGGILRRRPCSLFPPVPANPLWPKSPTQFAPEMKAPVLGLYGEADTGIPVAAVEASKAALAENKKTAEFTIYPGAPHGFHADYRSSYRKDAADDGWSQMQAWFKRYNVLS